MNLRHYEVFQAVAETGSFTQAAERLAVTQSAVSHAIRELEEGAGTILVERRPRGIRLTRAGILLLEDAVPFLASWERLSEKLPKLEQQAPLRLASSITIAVHFLPYFLKQFARIFLETPVETQVVSASCAADLLREGKADLALLEGVMPEGPFIGRVFGSYGIRAFGSPEFFTRTEPMSMEELCRQPLLLRETGSAIRDTVDSALLLKGFTVRPKITSVNSQALIEAAKAGLGITVLPELLVQKELSEGTLASVEAEGFPLSNAMSAVYRSDSRVTAVLEGFLQVTGRLGEKREEGWSGESVQ